MMKSQSVPILLILALCAITTHAFPTSFLGTTSSRVSLYRPTAVKYSSRNLSMRVVSIDSEAAFDKTIASAGSSLVIVDYSTTWCGPCKVIAPKFDELSDKYTSTIFLKVIGDASPDASKLMKREGVRSVPSFHYFLNGKRVDVVNGANAEAIETTIKKHS